jgi:outer membrane protein assembly factor BamB
MNASSIFLGINGNVFCIDRTTGQELWSADLKGTGFVNLLVDRDLVIATTHGEVWGLDVATGQIVWHNSMQGQGFGLVSIATPLGSTGAVTIERHRQVQQESAAAQTPILTTG